MDQFILTFIDQAREFVNRAEILLLALELEDQRQENSKELWRLIHNVKGSALSVGLKDVGRLAHALQNELDFLATMDLDHQDRDVSKCLRLLDEIKAALVQHGGCDLEFDNLTLMQHFVPQQPALASLDAVTAKAKVFESAPSKPLAANQGETDQTSSHKDQNFYFRAAMRAGQTIFTEEDSILAATMTRLAGLHFTLDRGFAGEILQALRQHPSFAELDRVCLAQRIGLSNQLRVVSSAVSFGDNLMPVGYRCTIAANGSLFRLSARSLRIFTSAGQLVRSFGEAPPQRSIYRIAKSGLKSGLTLGIYQNELPRGFFFLNSRSASFLSAIEERLHLLSTPALIARSLILVDSIDPVYERLWLENPDNFHVAFAEKVGLEKCWLFIASQLGIDPSRTNFKIASSTSRPWLISHGDLCFVLVKAIQAVGLSKVDVIIFADQTRITIEMNFGSEFQILPAAISGIRPISRQLGFEFATFERGIFLYLPSDWCESTQESPYSIEWDSEASQLG